MKRENLDEVKKLDAEIKELEILSEYLDICKLKHTNGKYANANINISLSSINYQTKEITKYVSILTPAIIAVAKEEIHKLITEKSLHLIEL